MGSLAEGAIKNGQSLTYTEGALATAERLSFLSSDRKLNTTDVYSRHNTHLQ